MLHLIRQDAYAIARQIVELAGMSPRQVERIIAGLKKQGFPVHCGARKNGC